MKKDPLNSDNLTSTSDKKRQDAILDALPETKQWDPVPGSIGYQAPETPNEDEDEEGRSESEQMVDDGIDKAKRDQIAQATTTAEKSDRQNQ